MDFSFIGGQSHFPYRNFTNCDSNEIADISGDLPLETAYENFITDRNTTSDDILVEKNLQTSALYAKLTLEYGQKQTILEDYNRELTTIKECGYKLKQHTESIKAIYVSHYPKAVDGLESLNGQIMEYYKNTNENVSNILNEKIMRLEIELGDISRKLNILRELILTSVNHTIKPEDSQKKMCAVCFDNEVNTALIPCGHTFCRGCSHQDTSRYSRCPQCRTMIDNRIKIYFSI